MWHFNLYITSEYYFLLQRKSLLLRKQQNDRNELCKLRGVWLLSTNSLFSNYLPRNDLQSNFLPRNSLLSTSLPSNSLPSTPVIRRCPLLIIFPLIARWCSPSALVERNDWLTNAYPLPNRASDPTLYYDKWTV